MTVTLGQQAFGTERCQEGTDNWTTERHRIIDGPMSSCLAPAGRHVSVTTRDSTVTSASRAEACQGARMAGRGSGFHSTFIGWIARQEMGEVWGNESGCSLGLHYGG